MNSRATAVRRSPEELRVSPITQAPRVLVTGGIGSFGKHFLKTVMAYA